MIKVHNECLEPFTLQKSYQQKTSVVVEQF